MTPPPTQPRDRTRRRDFPGWHMVWALSVTETIAYAALFYCLAVMVVPMREELGASTGELSGALSLAIAVNGAVAIPVGWAARACRATTSAADGSTPCRRGAGCL